MDSLRSRLLAGIALLVFAGLFVSGVATYAALHSFLTQRINDQLISEGPLASSLLGASGGKPGGGPGHGREPAPASGLPEGTYLALYTPGGALISERHQAGRGEGAPFRASDPPPP